jgi:heme A synthase
VSAPVRGWVRQGHRWVSMAFTLTVIANFVAMANGTPPAWITYAPLLPLALLLLSGLVLFAKPYVAGARTADQARTGTSA